jgi:hypothetical protein
MDVKFWIFVNAFIVISIFLLVALNLYKASVDTLGRLDKLKFRKGLVFLAKLILALLLGAFIFSVLLMSIQYRGKCPSTYVEVTDQTSDCSFWQFYFRMSLLRLFTGSRFYWP